MNGKELAGNRKYYRVFTFQDESVVNKLLKDGIYVKEESSKFTEGKDGSYISVPDVMRVDHHELYMKELGLDNPDYYEKDSDGFYECDHFPIYSFLSFGGIFLDYMPLNLRCFSSNWSQLMGYYRLDGRKCIIEMLVPVEECCIGFRDYCGLATSLLGTDKQLDVVTRYIKLDWVREIYYRDDEYSGYGKVTVTPSMKKFEDALFIRPVVFSGDGYGMENYDVIQDGREPLVGFTMEDNLSRLNSMEYRALRDIVFDSIGVAIPDDLDDKSKNILYDKLFNLCRDIHVTEDMLEKYRELIKNN